MSRRSDAAKPADGWDAFLQRLHDGPLQEGTALKVALAVWERAVERGDQEGASLAVDMAKRQLTQLLESLAQLERDGRARLESGAGPPGNRPRS